MTENRVKIPDEIYRFSDRWHLDHFPPITNKRNHTVLFQLPLPNDSSHPPEPRIGAHKWDLSHVRLPCSTENELQIKSLVRLTNKNDYIFDSNQCSSEFDIFDLLDWSRRNWNEKTMGSYPKCSIGRHSINPRIRRSDFNLQSRIWKYMEFRTIAHALWKGVSISALHSPK